MNEEKLFKVVYEILTRISSDIYVNSNGIDTIEIVSFETLHNGELETIWRIFEENGLKVKNVEVGPGMLFVLLRIELEEVKKK